MRAIERKCHLSLRMKREYFRSTSGIFRRISRVWQSLFHFAVSNGCGSHRSGNCRTVTKSEEHNTNHTVKRLAREITTEITYSYVCEKRVTRSDYMKEAVLGWSSQRVRHFARAFFQDAYVAKITNLILRFFSLPSSSRNNRDSKYNSRSPKRSSPREREKFLAFFFLDSLFLFARVNDRFYAKIFEHYR